MREAETHLRDYFKRKGAKVRYVYDFGDSTFRPAAEHGTFKLKRHREWQFIGRILSEITQATPR